MLISSCTQPISLRKINIHEPGITSYGGAPERNFFVNKNLGDSLAFKWKSDTHGSFPHTTISVYNDYIFAPDLSGRVYIFNKSDGVITGYEIFKGEVPTAVVIETNKFMFIHNEFKEN